MTCRRILKMTCAPCIQYTPIPLIVRILVSEKNCTTQKSTNAEFLHLCVHRLEIRLNVKYTSENCIIQGLGVSKM